MSKPVFSSLKNSQFKTSFVHSLHDIFYMNYSSVFFAFVPSFKSVLENSRQQE